RAHLELVYGDVLVRGRRFGLPLGGRRLPALVDRDRDANGTILLRVAEVLFDPGLRAPAFLEVDRVDDRAAADALQPRLDHVGLGRVEDDRDRHLRREA